MSDLATPVAASRTYRLRLAAASRGTSRPHRPGCRCGHTRDREDQRRVGLHDRQRGGIPDDPPGYPRPADCQRVRRLGPGRASPRLQVLLISTRCCFGAPRHREFQPSNGRFGWFPLHRDRARSLPIAIQLHRKQIARNTRSRHSPVCSFDVGLNGSIRQKDGKKIRVVRLLRVAGRDRPQSALVEPPPGLASGRSETGRYANEAHLLLPRCEVDPTSCRIASELAG